MNTAIIASLVCIAIGILSALSLKRQGLWPHDKFSTSIMFLSIPIAYSVSIFIFRWYDFTLFLSGIQSLSIIIMHFKILIKNNKLNL